MPAAPPTLAVCDGMRIVSEESSFSAGASRGTYHHILLKIWVRQWVPGGRVLLQWAPMVPNIEQLTGAHLVPREVTSSSLNVAFRARLMRGCYIRGAVNARLMHG